MTRDEVANNDKKRVLNGWQHAEHALHDSTICTTSIVKSKHILANLLEPLQPIPTRGFIQAHHHRPRQQGIRTILSPVELHQRVGVDEMEQRPEDAGSHVVLDLNAHRPILLPRATFQDGGGEGRRPRGEHAPVRRDRLAGDEERDVGAILARQHLAEVLLQVGERRRNACRRVHWCFEQNGDRALDQQGVVWLDVSVFRRIAPRHQEHVLWLAIGEDGCHYHLLERAGCGRGGLIDLMIIDKAASERRRHGALAVARQGEAQLYVGAGVAGAGAVVVSGREDLDQPVVSAHGDRTRRDQILPVRGRRVPVDPEQLHAPRRLREVDGGVLHVSGLRRRSSVNYRLYIYPFVDFKSKRFITRFTKRHNLLQESVLVPTIYN